MLMLFGSNKGGYEQDIAAFHGWVLTVQQPRVGRGGGGVGGGVGGEEETLSRHVSPLLT